MDKKVQETEKRYDYFGVMLDVSRNAVMKVSEVKRFIDCLQKMGYNALELYSEDTFEIEGEPYFGYMRGRYTGAELKEIDAYAKEKGIELIPCIQTLAHFTNLFRHAVYAPIHDCTDILFVGEEKTYEFLDKIFKTLAENFTSRRVNIGMDEAYMVGLGQYLQKNGYQDRYEMLLKHLERVAEIAKKYGFTAHMWHDMVYRLKTDEDSGRTLPQNVELTYWDYYHQSREHYEKQFDNVKAFGRDVWFAGGAWSWNGFAPMAEFTFRTMKPAMEAVIEKGIKNVLITMWGDNGKECSFFSLIHALYAIRQYADGNFDQAKIEDGFYKLFKMKFSDFMLLDLPNRLYYDISIEWQQNPCKCLLYSDPFMGLLDKSLAGQRAIPYASYAEDLKKAAKRVGAGYSYIFDSLSKLCSALALKAELGLEIRRAYQAKDKKKLLECAKRCTAAVARLKVFHEAFYTLWNKENKPQGWEVQDARLGGLMLRLETCAKRLKDYVAGKTDTIPELEEELLQFRDGAQLQHNMYHELISFGTTSTV